MDSREYSDIKKYIENKWGIVFNEHNRHLLESHIVKILKNLKLHHIEELYVKLCIHLDVETHQQVIDAITTNETFWFRDKALWDLLEKQFIPDYIERLRSNKVDKIRIWSAACSYGQEPYSIAMTISRYLDHHRIEGVSLNDFEIIATDISSVALSIAQKGEYDSVSVSRGLTETDRNLFFEKQQEMWKLTDTIRKGVQFRTMNLMDPSYQEGVYDLILFRNVMIYFSETIKSQMYIKIASALKNEGVLFIGSSELMEDERHIFERQQKLEGIYYTKKLQ